MNFEELISRCISKMSEEKLTNRDVAQRANISESTVSRTLASRGANATAATITAICDALGVQPEVERYEIIDRTATRDEIYLARIDDFKAVIQSKSRWNRALFIVCLVLVAFLLTVLAVDLLNPTVGWIRA